MDRMRMTEGDVKAVERAADAEIMDVLGFPGCRNWDLKYERFLLQLFSAAWEETGVCSNTYFPEALKSVRRPECDTESQIAVAVPLFLLSMMRKNLNYTYFHDLVDGLERIRLRWTGVRRDEEGNVLLGPDGLPLAEEVDVPMAVKHGGYSFSDGEFIAEVDRRVWRAVCGYASSVRPLDMTVAMRLTSKYALRFYEIINVHRGEFTYTLEELSRMFMWRAGRKRFVYSDFSHNVLTSAMNNLSKKTRFSFTCRINPKPGARGGRKPAASLTFSPYWKDGMTVLRDEVTDLLVNGSGCSMEELMPLAGPLFEAGQRMTGRERGLPGLTDCLRLILPLARKGDNVPAYLMTALESHLRLCYGYVPPQVRPPASSAFIPSFFSP